MKLWHPGIKREPVFFCTCCGTGFYDNELAAFQRHVGPCAKSNLAELKAQSLKARMPVFDPENWDPEVRAHMDKVGETMKRERRLTVKPSERAGF